MESLKKCNIIDCHENFTNFLAMTERQNAMTKTTASLRGVSRSNP
ncbi:hypothetical protein [Helicobacter rodentium]|nr:hypothetical protein [Helicobacter rodentium]